MFADRKDAALQLAKALEKYSDRQVIVLGIPRGGIETAYYVARQLHAHLSLIIVRKLGHPQNPELAFGAIAEDGTVYFTPTAGRRISSQMMDTITIQQHKEIELRKLSLRNDHPLPDLLYQTVLLVDDGIATGATIFAAIYMCRKLGAAKIIVAAPVASTDKVTELQQVADEVIVLQSPARYHAVSQVYDSFYNLTDSEALSFIEKWERETRDAGMHFPERRRHS